MTQNPYAGSGFDDAISEPPRTSAMAVVSLVLSLIGCCLPIGLLGSLLGVFALFGIARSDGRVTGKGLAVAGIIVGIINTLLWVGFVYGSNVFYDKFYAGITESVMVDIEAADLPAVQAAVSPAAAITDEQIAYFRETYQDHLGSFQRVPDGWIEFFQTVQDPAIGPSMGNASGQNIIPMPGIFDNGNALMLFELDQTAQQPSGMPQFIDITILLPDGTEINLSDPVPAQDAPDTPGGG